MSVAVGTRGWWPDTCAMDGAGTCGWGPGCMGGGRTCVVVVVRQCCRGC